MNIEKIINEIRNPFTEQLTEDEFDIVCEVHHWIGKIYNNGMIILEWRQHDEFWIRPIFEALNCEVSIWEDEEGGSGIDIERKIKK